MATTETVTVTEGLENGSNITTTTTVTVTAPTTQLPATDGIEFLYHGGFAGRLGAIMLICEDAGIPYTIDTDLTAYFGEGNISWKEGAPAKSLSTMPSFYTPSMKHGDYVLGGTTAVVAYLSKLAGYTPADFQDEMLAQGLAGYAADIWSSAYEARQKDDKGAEYLKGRFMQWLNFFEDSLASKPGTYYLGDDISYADFLLYDPLCACVDMWGEKLPAFPTKLAAWKAAIEARPNVKAFQASDRYLPPLYPGVRSGDLPSDF